MSNKLPENYTSCDLLPFNRTALEKDFVLEHPGNDPGGPGFRLMLQGSSVLVNNDRGLSLPRDKQVTGLESSQRAIYIGRWREEPCRLQPISKRAEIPPLLHRVNILGHKPGLALSLLSLAGLGNAILHWEKTSRHCDNCGGTMERSAGDWGKKCCACGTLHYPRIHPCIIVLVRRDDRVLLVRKLEWPAERFSLVAGFVEFGENLEQTVVRELREETGIEVANICYRGSQSWPFPSQLMAGFTADYAGGEIVLQADELSDGGWFPLNNLPQLPPRRSIARWLIDMAVKDIHLRENVVKS